ncbi:unnamed protein product [Mytilus edulis]|uniref:Uncharacterized protein n=1 Tax=Mytilus edulis TaxID=6550 RepID=A0A8S3V612_MYTED|nr:unnamed protein product [Mytilus edulis]
MILERVPKILSDDSQKINVSLESGLVIGMVVAVVLLVCVGVLIICIVRRKMLGRKPEEERTTDLDNSGANQSASLTSGLKQKTDQTNNSKDLGIHETQFAGNESYALAKPTSLSENKQKLKTEQDDIYCQSEEGTYDVSGCNRHKVADGNIYSHTVDDVYDSTTHKRNDDEQEDKYDHFIGQKTEDLYDISMQS